MRLILSTFAILALVFYEMSGGADFKPPLRPEPVADAPKQDLSSVMQVAAAVAPQAKPDSPATTEPEPVILSDAPGPLPTAEDDTDTQALNQVRSSLSAGLTLMPSSNPSGALQLVSLELGAYGLIAASPDVGSDEQPTAALSNEPERALQAQDRDLREVTGTRVNMRDGPGTIYPVVARLTIGHNVEVLSDSGTGWLRLRTLPEQQLGWISASLISRSGQ